MTEGSNTLTPPEPIFSDYFEMSSLVLMFLAGAPLNLAAYTQLSERPITSRLDLLKRHLNMADLLVVFIYIPSRTCWLMTYDWRGGDLLCKLVKMMHTLAFQSSSNVIVCIAIDRFMQVISPTNNCPTRGKNRTRTMLFIAWTFAFVASFPQLFVWKNYTAIPSLNWNQCLQIWEIERLKDPNKVASLFDAESLYSIVHIGLVFWIPAVIIFSCYGFVLAWVWVNSRPVTHVRQCGSFGGCDTVDTMLTRNSTEWNPLRTFSISKEKEKKFISVGPPRIVVSSEDSAEPLARPSITPSEASAVLRTNVHTAQSYHASVNRARALRVSFLLVTCYIICWLPYNLLSLFHLLEPELFSVTVNKLYFLHELMVFNAVLNPYLYGLFGCTAKRRPPM